MRESTLELYDRSDFRRLLIGFPQQIDEAVRIAGRVRPPCRGSAINAIIVTGLGGSAIGGDLLRSYLSGDLKVPLIVNRSYELPAFVGRRTLVIVSSYSGGTEETISAHAEAAKRRAHVLCVTSGGETARLARKFGHSLITIPRGLPPRAALGYSFFTALTALSGMALIPSKKRDIGETIALLRRSAKRFSSLRGDNPALALAKRLYARLPIVYSAGDRFDAVNVRWRGQFAENAKVLSFGHVLPEMNHNELVGWKMLRRIMEDMIVVILRDKGDHPRVRRRMDITRSIVDQYASAVVEVRSEGKSLLARTFSLVYLGDWASYYLAMLNGIDPTPVSIIDYLKHVLSKE